MTVVISDCLLSMSVCGGGSVQNAQLQTTKRELVEAEIARNNALESLRLSETRVAEADSESQRFSEKIVQLEATILRLQVRKNHH